MTKSYLFEGEGTAIGDGTACTTANTGALNVSANGGSITFRTSAKAQGNFGVQIVSAVGQACVIDMGAEASSMTFQRTVEAKIPTPLPAGSDVPTIVSIRARASDGTLSTILRWTVDSTGALFLNRSLGGAAIAMGTGYTAGQQLRLAVWGQVATATTGILHGRAYNHGSSTPLASHDSTNSNLGTNPVTQGFLGITSAYTTSYTVAFDSDQWGTLNAELPAVAANVPPTVTVASASVTLGTSGGAVSLSATGADTDGSIVSYAWDFTVVPPGTSAPTIVNPAAASTSVNITNPGRYVIRCTVTDNSGATAVGYKKVFVPASVVRPIMDIANPGSYTITGTTAAYGALADESDSTYVASPAGPTSEALLRVLLAPQSVPTTWSMDIKDDLDTSGSATCKVRLYEVSIAGDGTYQGGTMRKEWTITPSTSATTHTVSLTSGEIATVTQWNETMIEMSRA